MTEAEIKQEIVKHEIERDKAWRTFHYHDGQIFRLNLKLKAISPEDCSLLPVADILCECKRISELIGKNVTHKAWQDKNIK